MKKYLFSITIIVSVVFIQNLLFYILYSFFDIVNVTSSSDNLYIIDFLTYLTVLIFIIIFLLLTRNKTKSTFKPEFFLKYLAMTILLVFTIYIILGPLLSRNISANNSSTVLIGFIKFLILVIIPPLNEELIFRRAILRMFEAGKGDVFIGILFSSILFTLVHADLYFEQNYKYLLTIFILGLLFGIIYYRFGLIYSIISHSLYSFFIFLYTDVYVNVNILSYIDNNVLSWIIYSLICITFIYIIARMLKIIYNSYT